MLAGAGLYNFKEKPDVLDNPGASTAQKLCTALYVISTGCSMDDAVDRSGLAESTVNTHAKRFYSRVMSFYE